MTRLGIVTGMRAEEDCLAAALATLPEKRQPLTFCAGANTKRAYDGTLNLVEEGASALLSIGIAGGLDVELRPGSVILPNIVISAEETRYRVSAGWHAAVIQELQQAAVGTLVGRNAPACTVAEKAMLHAETGAIAVDMESGAVAAAAEHANIPFLVLRIIADPADRAIPSTALAGIGPDGERHALAVLGKLLLRPAELPALIGLARDSKAAFRQLSRVASLGRALFAPPVI